jgi:DNA polymerase V
MVEELRLPLIGPRVEAGFPSPADDFIEGSLDLNEQLIDNPIATFFVRASGHSMHGAGIHDGDLLVVDRAITPVSGSIVIAVIDGGLTVKRLSKQGLKASLLPEPSVADQGTYKPIEITIETDATIWGVVTWSLHRTICTH